MFVAEILINGAICLSAIVGVTFWLQIFSVLSTPSLQSNSYKRVSQAANMSELPAVYIVSVARTPIGSFMG